jgi:Ca-activated chloride channel family protein
MIHFERPLLLLLLLAVPVLGALWWRACRIVKATCDHYGFAGAGRLNAARGALRLAALTALILGAAGPVWVGGGDTGASGTSVIFVLDASASMNAQDVAPDRLSAAKAAIARTVDLLAGDALGLVAASSAPAVVCPPTTDRQAFLMLLERVDTEWASGSGTQLAAALHTARRALQRAGAPTGAVVLVTDGEDHGPPATREVKELRRCGFALHAVCVGGQAPAAVLERDLKDELTPKTDKDGRKVMSRARPAEMQRLSADGGGRFWSVSPAGVSLPASRAAITDATRDVALPGAGGGTSLFAWLCLLAAALLATDAALGLAACPSKH